MIRSRKKPKIYYLLAKNCEMLLKQTQTKPPETLEFKPNKSRETFVFKTSNFHGLDNNCMVGLSSLEVYNPFFNTTEENNKFEIYTNTFDEFSFAELKDEVEDILDISNITSERLQDVIKGPRINSA